MIFSRFAAIFAAAVLLFSSPVFSASTSFEDALRSSSELYEQGRFQEAIPLAKKALAITEQEVCTDHLSFAGFLDKLAALYEAEFRYTEAQQLYCRALDFRVKALGVRHPEIIKSLINLALVYDALGNYGEAEKMDARATEIIEASNK